MKGFLITVGICLTLAIAAISQIDTLCMSFYAKSTEIEGGEPGKAVFDKLKQDSPDQFRLKFQDALQNRLTVGRVLYFMGGDEAFKTVAEATRDLYLDSPLGNDDDLAVLLHRRAKMLEERQPDQYYARLKELEERFPQASFKPDLDKEVKLIKIRLNII